MGMGRTHTSHSHRADADAAGLPSCFRLNELLEERGYSPLKLSPKDVDLTTHTIPSTLVNAWSASLLLCTHEILTQLDHTRSTVQDVSHSLRKGGLAQDTLLSRVSVLQGKLKEAQRKAAQVELNNPVLEEEKVTRSRCVLCTECCVLCTECCVLCTVCCVLCAVYCVLCTVYCVLCTVY